MNESMSEQNPKNHMDPTWQMHMRDVDEEEEEYGDRTDIDSALFEYYSEKGLQSHNGAEKKIHNGGLIIYRN